MHAPELAAIVLLEHALAVAGAALLAEHVTLTDDFQTPREQGAVVFLARAIRAREASLRKLLRRYRLAVREAAAPPPVDSSDDNLF